MQRLAHHARLEHLLHGHLGREHGVGVVDAVGAVLHDDLGELALVDPAVAHQPLGAQREVGGRGREPDGLLPRREEARPDDALGHLLHAEDEDGVALARPDGAGAERQGGGARGAPGLDVDDRSARETEGAQHLVPRRHAPVRRAAERRLERASCPASSRAARTASTPMSVAVLSPWRPNGWMPTPAISTDVMMPMPAPAPVRTPTSMSHR